MNNINYGWRYNNLTRKMEYDYNRVAKDMEMKPDEFTAKVLQEVANSIMPEIQWTYDAHLCTVMENAHA